MTGKRHGKVAQDISVWLLYRRFLDRNGSACSIAWCRGYTSTSLLCMNLKRTFLLPWYTHCTFKLVVHASFPSRTASSWTTVSASMTDVMYPPCRVLATLHICCSTVNCAQARSSPTLKRFICKENASNTQS